MEKDELIEISEDLWSFLDSINRKEIPHPSRIYEKTHLAVKKILKNREIGKYSASPWVELFIYLDEKLNNLKKFFWLIDVPEQEIDSYGDAAAALKLLCISVNEPEKFEQYYYGFNFEQLDIHSLLFYHILFFEGIYLPIVDAANYVLSSSGIINCVYFDYQEKKSKPAKIIKEIAEIRTKYKLKYLREGLNQLNYDRSNIESLVRDEDRIIRNEITHIDYELPEPVRPYDPLEGVEGLPVFNKITFLASYENLKDKYEYDTLSFTWRIYELLLWSFELLAWIINVVALFEQKKEE